MVKSLTITNKDPLNTLERAGRILLGAIFVYASLDKILDPAAFAQAIANYQILPPTWVNAVALMLPWLEAVGGVCLITGKLMRGSALAITLMLIVFMGALGYNAYRGVDIACGCFSLNNEAAGRIYMDLSRDAALLAVALMVLVRTRTTAPLKQPYRQPR